MQRLIAVILLTLVGCQDPETAAPPVAFAPASKDPTADSSTSNSQSAADIVEDFVRHLNREQGAKAVRLYWDSKTFAKRVYGPDFDALSPEDQASTALEHERFMMSIYGLPKAAATMKNLQVQNIHVSEDAGLTTAVFDAHVGDPAQSKPITWVFQHAKGQLKLVDMSNADDGALLSSLLEPAYDSTGLNPLQYVRAMTKEIPAVEELMGD